MPLLNKILNRINVLVAVFTDAGSYSLFLAKCCWLKGEVKCMDVLDVAELSDIRKELTVSPVIVLAGGYGIITKQADASGDIVAKVTAAGSGFLWTRSVNDISFVRGEQLAGLRQALEKAKAKIVGIQCTASVKEASIEDIGNIAEDCSRWYYAETVNFKTILKPSIIGSALAWLTASKLKLPVLGITMLSLMVNMMLSSGVQGRHETARMELDVIYRTIGQIDEATRRQQDFISEHDRALPHRISLMCDRMAAALPESITLASLAVQPPVRSLENNKTTAFADNRIIISGESPTAESISEYVAALSGLGFVARVQLSSIEQDRDSGIFNFKITTDL